MSRIPNEGLIESARVKAYLKIGLDFYEDIIEPEPVDESYANIPPQWWDLDLTPVKVIPKTRRQRAREFFSVHRLYNYAVLTVLVITGITVSYMGYLGLGDNRW